MNDRLRALIAEFLEVDPRTVTADMRRGDTDAWDSMSHLRLITAVEGEFGVAFTMDEIENLQSPGELQRAIEEHQDAGRSDPAEPSVSD